jgi:tetratricopeptide (TPR) repeat protein
MRIRGAMTVLSYVSILALSFALSGAMNCASADTIVLKNGRRITVNVAKETADRVIGETDAGEISLPKSMVERIEHGPVDMPTSANRGSASAGGNTSGGTSTSQSTSVNGSAKGIGFDAPTTQSVFVIDERIARAVIHDGSVDHIFIAQLEQAALAGTPDAANRAAAAHEAAAAFEANKGNLDAAVEQEAQALRFTPDNLNLLMDVAFAHLRRSEYSKALDYLTRAKRLAPDSPDVAKLLGWSEYGLNRIPDAVAEWKRAQKLRPEPDVAQALEKAERDAKTEQDFREGQTSHFVLKYSGAAQPELASDILRILEIHFDQISAMLNYSPPEPIGVILYTGQQFEDITRAPAWVGAINDGRIRVPVQGLTSVNDQLSRVLRHELTHSFLQQKTRGRCPAWLQEGIAQWMEGRRSNNSAAGLLAAYDQHASIPLSSLEISWMQLSGTGAAFAYSWSLAAVETILANGNMAQLVQLVDTVTSTGSTEAAVRQVLHESYPDLEKQTADYLRSTYH